MAVASLTFTTEDIWLKGTGSVGQVWAVRVSGIPEKATIKSVTLTFANGKQYNAPSNSSIYKGNDAIVSNRVWYKSGTLDGGSDSVNLTSYITGNGTFNLYFYKTANGSSSNSNVYFSNVEIAVVYEKPAGTVKRAEGDQLISYRLHRVEDGSLVSYSVYHCEGNTLVKY